MRNTLYVTLSFWTYLFHSPCCVFQCSVRDEYSTGDKVGTVTPHEGRKGNTSILNFKNSIDQNMILFIVTLYGQLQMTLVVKSGSTSLFNTPHQVSLVSFPYTETKHEEFLKARRRQITQFQTGSKGHECPTEGKKHCMGSGKRNEVVAVTNHQLGL